METISRVLGGAVNATTQGMMGMIIMIILTVLFIIGYICFLAGAELKYGSLF